MSREDAGLNSFCRLTVQPEGKTVEVERGITVMRALQRQDGLERSDCGGAGVCGKCRVLAGDSTGLSPLTSQEIDRLGDELVAQGYRLACMTTLTGEATVTVAKAAGGDDSPRGKVVDAPLCPPDPSVRRIFIAAEMLQEAEYAELICHVLQERLSGWDDFVPADMGKQLSWLLDNCPLEGGVTLIVHEQLGVTGVLPGDRTKRSLGMAVDLGTTTIAAYLCDLQSGQQLASRAMFNPQRKYGDDVISRISSAAEGETVLSEMQQVVVKALEQLAGQCLADCGLQMDDLDELVVVGNTTMQTIFAGDSPESLGRAPYLPKVMVAQNVPVEKLGFGCRETTNVYIFPVISGFLGGDSVAAALGGELAHHTEPRLIIDIGTNGELLLGCGERIVATSCATGPALEGAAISCGMRAVAGAIDRVEVDEENNCLRCHTIGAEKGALPVGICGSGLIDAMACLRKLGVLQESGRMDIDVPGVSCDEFGMGKSYAMVPAGQSGTGSDVVLTLPDVRAFQLAKSALVVGIEKLLEWYGLEEVPYTCITGAFGAHFNWRNGLAVDLLPAKATTGEVSSGANLAGAGAMMALLNREKRREAEALASRCTALELAADPGFNMQFVERTKFPALKN